MYCSAGETIIMLSSSSFGAMFIGVSVLVANWSNDASITVETVPSGRGIEMFTV